MSQHLAALESANRIRLSRAELRRTLRHLNPPDSLETFKAALDEPEPEWEGQNVFQLLCCVKRYGRSRSLRAIHAAGVSESCTLGCLTDRQREALKGAAK